MKQIFIDDFQIHHYITPSLGYSVYPDIQGLESADIRLPIFVKPNVDGASIPTQLYGGRLITLTGKVSGNDPAIYAQRRRDLEEASAIKRDENGRKKALILKFTTMDDLDLQVEVYRKALNFPIKHNNWGVYKMDLQAASPYIYGQELKSIDVFIFNGGGMGIPMGIPMNMGIAGGSNSTIINEGNIDSFPVYTIRGPVDDPTFTNLTTADSFSLNYTLTTADEFIVIDTVRGTVVYYADSTASPVNIRQYFSGDFVTLAKGINNVRLTNSNYNALGLINIVYRDSYTGV